VSNHIKREITTLQSSADCAAPPAGVERRRSPTPTTPLDFLCQLPARVMLDRLPSPALVIDGEGGVVYANPAFAALLGYPDATGPVDQSLSKLMEGDAQTPPHRILAASQAAAVISWRHIEGHLLHTVVSPTLLTCATDLLLLITLTDVTDLRWEHDGQEY
jgi:PAS domain-containing protein